MITKIEEVLQPTCTALLVIDMQVGFVSSHGSLGKLLPNLDERFADPISNTLKMVQACRTLDMPVVWVRTENDPHTMTPSQLFNQNRRKEGVAGILCKSGSADCEIIPELKKAMDLNDIVITKQNSFDAFRGQTTDEKTLNDVLKGRGVGTLLISGATTEMCVFISANSSQEAGYYTILLKDAVQSTDDARQILAQQIINRLVVADAITVDDAINHLSSHK